MTAVARQLAGARVLITRSEDDSAEWAAELERRGAQLRRVDRLRADAG